MKHFIAAVALATSASFACAGITTGDVSSAGFDKLSEAQKAQILEGVQKQAQLNSSIGVLEKASDPATVQKWVDVGTNIGKSLGGAAKEVGVAVNDFVETPVGMLTAFLIVWHVMGAALVHFFGGILIFILGFSMLTYLMRRSKGYIKKYDKESGKLISEELEELSSDATVGWVLSYTAVLSAGMIAMFTF